MPADPQKIFERYILAMMNRDADAQAELFAPDGVIEAPLVPAGSTYPRRMQGREEIRTGLRAIHERSATVIRKVNVEASRYVLHTTADPDVFIVEIDTAVEIDGEPTTMSLVQIYRLRDGEVVEMRDYFAPEHVT